ncbi:MAG: PIG-L family deacetylase [Candidatus Firestonebacteria bacterium]
MKTKLRILAVGANPDDVELLCGGTLAKYSKLGHTVIISHVTNGDLGHFHIPRNKLAKIRIKEAQKAGKLIKAEKVINLNFHDLDVHHDRKDIKKFIDMIREAKPDLIITHDPNDYMPDHVATSRLVVDASFIATLPQLKTKHIYHPKVTPIYYMDTVAGVNFAPTEYVDITGVMETKKKMLGCHESQITWMKEHDKIDFIEFMMIVAKFRGLQSNVTYAESFRQAKIWPRNITERLLP